MSVSFPPSLSMDRSPLLSHTTETRGTYERPSQPPRDPNETNEIGAVNISMPSNEQWDRTSIYKVPSYISILCDKAYRPQVVSFGPYHYADESLSPMEEHKRRALAQFEKRSGQPLENLIQSLGRVKQELMDSYDKLDSVWQEEDKFLELMITDGCFMLEIMRTKIEANPTPNHAENEPIFSTHWFTYIKPYISWDMLLLENQLPMLVLYHLVAKDKNKEPNECIKETNNLILGFYGIRTMEERRCLHVLDVFRKGLLLPDPKKDRPEMNNVGPEAGEQIIFSNCVRTILKFCFLEKCITGMRGCLWHVVDICRKIRLHVVDISRKIRLMETKNDQHEETEKIIRSATELNKTGIQFEKSLTHSLEDISFAGGVLKLPVIMVDGTTESKFLNLTTFERLHGTGNEITSYIGFMDSIINNEHDVALLHTKGIIQNAMGSDKAVAKLFNALCQEVPVEFNRSICEVQEDISEYYKDPSNSSWANFHDTYCSSPWARLSLFAAVFLFTLTIIQTVYAMLSYY